MGLRDGENPGWLQMPPHILEYGVVVTEVQPVQKVSLLFLLLHNVRRLKVSVTHRI